MKFFRDEWEEFLAGCDFTDEEREIIALLRRGWYNVDIAAELNISLRTEERRVHAIGNKIKRYLLRKG